MTHRIHRSFFILLAIGYIVSPNIIHAQSFEGVITMQMSIPQLGDQKIDLVNNIKGDQSVAIMDMPVIGATKTFTNTKTHKTTVVMEAQKMGIEMDQSMMDSMAKGKEMPEPKSGGKSMMIKGYNCDLYATTLDQGIEMNMWLTKEFPKEVSTAIRNSIENSMKTGGAHSNGFLKLFNSGYVPVRIEGKDSKGELQMSIEFQKFESKKLDDSIFNIPTDIKVTPYDPATMGGMGGGGQ